MNYISTYDAISKRIIRVNIPSTLFGVFVFWVIYMKVFSGYHWLLNFILLCVAIYFFYRHVKLNWLKWALRRVDDIHHFLKMLEIYDLYNPEELPDSSKIILQERKENNLFVIKNDDALPLSDFHFYESFKGTAWMLFLGFSLSCLYFSPSESFDSIPLLPPLIEKIILVGLGFLLFFVGLVSCLGTLYDILNNSRTPVFTIGNDGVMIKKYFLKWDIIIYIDVIARKRRDDERRGWSMKKRVIRVTYKKQYGNFEAIETDIEYINASAAKLAEIIKSYKQHKGIVGVDNTIDPIPTIATKISSKKTTLLNCSDMQLTTLDVSKNIDLIYLKHLYCFKNKLTELDVSANTHLETLHCDNNQLTALDVSKNTYLTELECHNNLLTKLDLSNNPMLTCLKCQSNQLDAAALNALFDTLHGKIISGATKKVYIQNNPGTNACDTSIARKKGWEVL